MASIQLCGPCNRFSIEETLQDLFSRLKNPDSTEVGGQQESPQKTWHSNLPTVFESSVKCELCKLILEGLREGRRQLVEETRFSGDWAETPKDFEDDILTIPYYSNATPNVKILAWFADSFEKENMISAIQGVENRLRAHAIIRVTCSGGVETVSSWDGYNEINCELRISSKNGGFGTHADIDPTVSEDPSSIEVINQLKFWISQCSTGHEKCNKYMHGPENLPTRLLNVGTLGSDLIHLEESGENPQTDQRYVALSHCWGTNQPFITSRENLKEHRQGILISQLPQTHQDGIRVTRALGLQYVWIDSLCIVQDDTQDWMHEAARMASVYRDAYVVIGASNASSDSEGFLGQRVIKVAIVNDKLRVSLLPPGAQRLTKVSEPVKSEPLSSRAWTLQERCLPRRMISYGKDKIFWECSEMAASEDGDCIPREGDRLDLIAKTAAIEMSICKITGRSPGEITDTNYFDWYETVKGYTRRRITKPVDRLPALAGLAKALAERTGDEYLAGIWKKGLIEGLLWYGEDDLLLTPTYRAPSWSWASVDGFINFTLYNFYGRCQWKYMMANFEFTATCIESVIKPTGQDQYGSIKSGWIRLNAPLFPITSVKSWNEVSYRSPGIMMDPLRSPVCDKIIETEIRYNGKSEKLWLDGAFDVKGTNTRGARLFVLLLARLPDPGSSSGYYLDIRFGLILEALGSNDEYKRVGIIDGTVKVRKASIASKLSGKLHLDPHLHKVKEIEGDDEIPNLLGPDPYEGLEQKIVKIV